MKRSKLFYAVSMLIVLLLLCSATVVFAGANTEAESVERAEAAGPVRGGRLIMGIVGKMSSLDPTRGNAFLWEGNVLLAINERLFRRSETGEFIPELATSWEVSQDKLHITFKLRQGVKFHDGTPFNAAAAKFNLDRLMDPAQATQVHTWFKDIESVDVIDEYSVRINLKQPAAMIMTLLTSTGGFMVSPEAMKKYGDDYSLHPVGTGPFKFVEWVPGDHVLVARNENYWGKGEDGKPLPYLDEILVRIITDDSVRLVEVQTGRIHIMQSVPAESIGIVKTDPNLALTRTPGAFVFRLYLNQRRSPTNNVVVRRAINYAFDREAMAKAIIPGQEFQSPFFYLPNSPEYLDETPYNYDPDKAKKLLAEAGYPNGLDLGLLLISREPDRTMAPIIQSYLEAVGIRTEIMELERLMAIEKANAGDWDLYQAMAGLPQPDTQVLMDNQWRTDGPWNRSGYSNQEMNALLDKLSVTFEPKERIKIYHEMQRKLLDEAETVVLFGRAVYQANTTALHGFTFEHVGALRLTEAWLEAE
ncbi:MAG: ABC transporter substrate-binding protein [Spirochaetaceae bacterium]|nr:MAG: ABC transporter substrate-binding protein [Spirochaetaceae bacterium]